MKIHLIAVGRRMPDWIQTGFNEYARRLPAECRLVLHEIATARGNKSISVDQRRTQEGDRLLAAIPAGSQRLALDERGTRWRTVQVAARLAAWLQSGRDVALLMGGADGLTEACRRRVDSLWSLSPLTLPHGLARIVVAEQLYRAWSYLNGHPYHRE